MKGALRRTQLLNLAAGRPAEERPLIASAVTGEGLDALKQAIAERLAADRETWRLRLPAEDGQGASALYSLGEVVDRVDEDGGATLFTVRVSAAKAGQLRRRFPQAEQVARARLTSR